MSRVRRHIHGSKSTYWWSDELTNLRSVATTTVRKLPRARKEKIMEEIVQYLDARRDARRALTRAIKEAKKNSWRDLLDSTEDDQWCSPYKIVLGKLRPYVPPVTETQKDEVLENILCELFPGGPGFDEPQEPALSEVTICAEEAFVAAKKGKGRKAPGLNGIPDSEARPDQNEKKRAPDTLGSYRPKCVIGELGKLFERVVVGRINIYLEEFRTLAPSQYGFRMGRSTVDAVLDVKKFVEASTRARKVIILGVKPEKLSTLPGEHRQELFR
ncbi:uncharacterized protein LOC124948563 [Vespa velutina]|uniref:uncharacterized protein LOC124948563 n=1 Tax=Vespa velutina TaxID=202808 RepID=UPI001FB343A3|nr:uncharacterized protein LOC124948563 [Vespa velutina]